MGNENESTNNTSEIVQSNLPQPYPTPKVLKDENLIQMTFSQHTYTSGSPIKGTLFLYPQTPLKITSLLIKFTRQRYYTVTNESVPKTHKDFLDLYITHIDLSNLNKNLHNANDSNYIIPLNENFYSFKFCINPPLFTEPSFCYENKTKKTLVYTKYYVVCELTTDDYFTIVNDKEVCIILPYLEGDKTEAKDFKYKIAGLNIFNKGECCISVLLDRNLYTHTMPISFSLFVNNTRSQVSIKSISYTIKRKIKIYDDTEISSRENFTSNNNKNNCLFEDLFSFKMISIKGINIEPGETKQMKLEYRFDIDQLNKDAIKDYHIFNYNKNDFILPTCGGKIYKCIYFLYIFIEFDGLFYEDREIEIPFMFSNNDKNNSIEEIFEDKKDVDVNKDDHCELNKDGFIDINKLYMDEEEEDIKSGKNNKEFNKVNKSVCLDNKFKLGMDEEEEENAFSILNRSDF